MILRGDPAELVGEKFDAVLCPAVRDAPDLKRSVR